MKKDIEWLKGRFRGRKIFKPQNDREIGYNMAIDEFSEYVDQLDESEITELDALNRLAESVQFSAGEIASHLEKLSAYNGQVTYGEPEVLSEEWIDKHAEHHEYIGYAGVPVKDLQNLLVPKHEETTEEQAWEVIHGKYGDEVLQNNIDYVESQGYVVIEKPTIPQFVADYIEEMEGTSWGNITDLFGQAEGTLGDWWQSHDNFEKIAKAWLFGYEVEKEKLYHIKFSENQYAQRFNDSKIDSILINDKAIAGKFTKEEIEKMNPNLMALAVEVEE